MSTPISLNIDGLWKSEGLDYNTKGLAGFKALRTLFRQTADTDGSNTLDETEATAFVRKYDKTNDDELNVNEIKCALRDIQNQLDKKRSKLDLKNDNEPADSTIAQSVAYLEWKYGNDLYSKALQQLETEMPHQGWTKCL